MEKRLSEVINFEIGTTRKVCASNVEAGKYCLKKFRKGTNTYLEVTNLETKSKVKSMRATMWAKIIDVDPKFRREDPLVRDVTNQVLCTMMISYMHMNGEMSND